MSEHRKPYKFDSESFERIKLEIRKGTLLNDDDPVVTFSLQDDVSPNLHARVRASDSVSFFIRYRIDNIDSYMALGKYPEMTIDDARKLTRIINDLASRGIDPQDEMRKRWLGELLTSDGTAGRA